MTFFHGNKILILIVIFTLIIVSMAVSNILMRKNIEVKKSLKEYELVKSELEKNNKKINEEIKI